VLYVISMDLVVWNKSFIYMYLLIFLTVAHKLGSHVIMFGSHNTGNCQFLTGLYHVFYYNIWLSNAKFPCQWTGVWAYSANLVLNCTIADVCPSYRIENKGNWQPRLIIVSTSFNIPIFVLNSGINVVWVIRPIHTRAASSNPCYAFQM